MLLISAAHHSISVCVQRLLAHCRENQSSWQSLNAAETIHHHQRHLVTSPVSHSLVFPCILSALRWINEGEQPVLKPAGSVGSTEFCDRLRETGTMSVLVTGSLYLVGGVLKHLEPTLDSYWSEPLLFHCWLRDIVSLINTLHSWFTFNSYILHSYLHSLYHSHSATVLL